MKHDPRAFRTALGSFATGVTIVTTRDRNGVDVGLTANSFNSVSLNPPMVLWSLSNTSSSIDVFREADHFAVHILAADQDELSSQFSRKNIDRFGGVAVERGATGIPLLQGCASRFECRTSYRYEGGDHTIFVGEVTAFDQSDRRPLVFHGGRYGLVVKTEGATPPAVLGGPSLSPHALGYLIWRLYYQVRRQTRAAGRRRGLTDADVFVLQLAGMQDERTMADVVREMEFTDLSCTPDLLRGLQGRGLLSLSEPLGPDTPLRVTDEGRRVIVELLAIAKSVEMEALDGFDPSEVQVLKQLLGRAIANSGPAPWTY